jgi:hypothetical protein
MAISGRVVLTPEEALPYKVVLERGAELVAEQGVATVRDGEQLIREHLPEPAAPELLRQWTSRP